MLTVKELLEKKGNRVWSLPPKASVYEALELMAEKDIGALVVVDGSQVVGLFSERDYARRVILKGRASRTTAVSELMSAPVVFVRPEKTTQDCMALMTQRHVRHLPVLEDRKLVGIVTIGDVVKAIIDEQNYTIQELESYIMSANG